MSYFFLVEGFFIRYVLNRIRGEDAGLINKRRCLISADFLRRELPRLLIGGGRATWACLYYATRAHFWLPVRSLCGGPWRDLTKVRVSFGHSERHPYVSVFVVFPCGSWKSDPVANSSTGVASLRADLSSLFSPPRQCWFQLSPHTQFAFLVSAAVCMRCLYKRPHSFLYMHNSALNGCDRVHLSFISSSW